ncbi:AbrB/MazE/SpoVT family DNA-binding domain-containing protein [Paenibacillus sp. GM2]|uniref:AbrB/MazE/SpoVT family DNA-binding domain-containing protein n=1 Tax=Paenibacillus sp. GM2 TaxID=1622070 RepID=UPI000838C68C|nr:AbrB/MazE/SpoVT family DNA-binding domain-containing protein [Paenibacillus sp. GM2]
MKATGIVRRVDDLGRVVIPKELRATLGIANGDTVEFFTDGNRVILRKYHPGCYICDNTEDLRTFHSKQICVNCIRAAALLYSK